MTCKRDVANACVAQHRNSYTPEFGSTSTIFQTSQRTLPILLLHIKLLDPLGGLILSTITIAPNRYIDTQIYKHTATQIHTDAKMKPWLCNITCVRVLFWYIIHMYVEMCIIHSTVAALRFYWFENISLTVVFCKSGCDSLPKKKPGSSLS